LGAAKDGQIPISSKQNEPPKYKSFKRISGDRPNFGIGVKRRRESNINLRGTFDLERIASIISHAWQDIQNQYIKQLRPEGSEDGNGTGFMGVQDVEDAEELFDGFDQRLKGSIAAHLQPESKSNYSEDIVEMFDSLRRLFVDAGPTGMKDKLRYYFLAYVSAAQMSKEKVTGLKKLAQLTYPAEWYPDTRAFQRKIHLHIGPTNSGKTYQALQRLEAAESGIYAGPLRLLAHEVYTRLNSKGRLCALLTGDDQRFPAGQSALMSSCTVEMVPLHRPVDVAVIDEIQMIADPDRGWAWTQCFLGVMAKEIHLCGEVRTEQLIRNLCHLTGDELIIHRYERLSGLETMNKSLKGNLKNLEKGDCVIAFSRVSIHALKREIENTTGKRCAMVYGSLPPETRAQQASLFNDPGNDYDYLVASDAVGMGLNLAIRRVIFESTVKYDGTKFQPLAISEIRQIGGRAGRFKTAAEAVKTALDKDVLTTVNAGEPLPPPKRDNNAPPGLVTSLEDADLKYVQHCFRTDDGVPQKACIMPPSAVIKRFATYFPRNTPLAFVILRFIDMAKTSSLFFLCDYKYRFATLDIIQPFDLSIDERLVFMASPAHIRDAADRNILCAYAAMVAERKDMELEDISELDLELLDRDIATSADDKEYLRKLEALHKGLVLYLWLSYRFTGVFRNQAKAFYVKGIVEERIDTALRDMRTKKTLSVKAAQKRKEYLDKLMREGQAQLRAARAGQSVDNQALTSLSFEDEDSQEPLFELDDEEVEDDDEGNGDELLDNDDESVTDHEGTQAKSDNSRTTAAEGDVPKA
jgi:ATP-dependent RNA helicase SUPV3L1/SUV3